MLASWVLIKVSQLYCGTFMKELHNKNWDWNLKPKGFSFFSPPTNAKPYPAVTPGSTWPTIPSTRTCSLRVYIPTNWAPGKTNFPLKQEPSQLSRSLQHPRGLKDGYFYARYFFCFRYFAISLEAIKSIFYKLKRLYWGKTAIVLTS